MTTKRRILREMGRAAGLNKWEVRDLCQGGTIVVDSTVDAELAARKENDGRKTNENLT